MHLHTFQFQQISLDATTLKCTPLPLLVDSSGHDLDL